MTDANFHLAPAPSAADGNGRVLVLSGRLMLAEGSRLWQQLRAELRAGGPCVVDLSAVESMDGGAAALLQEARAEAVAAGNAVELRGARGEAAQLLDLYACPTVTGCLKPAPVQIGMLDQIGRAAVEVGRELRAILAFTGDLVVGLGQALRRPRSVHWRDLGRLMERAGADGLPIVALLNFLIGLILGLQGAIQLSRYGGEVFLAYLVGISVVRELGPLMTAVLVTGRSGAAFAAELGTMQVNEEVDALRTLGQDPQRFLVLPRVMALVLVVPMLTVLADLVGCLGGLFIAVTYQGQPPVTYLQQLREALDLSDVLTGLLKSVFFAGLIALVACQRGLQARGGAEGVGRSTTSAVVVVVFGLVVLDAVFTLVFSVLEW